MSILILFYHHESSILWENETLNQWIQKLMSILAVFYHLWVINPMGNMET
jgi:hypothetical protein